MLISELKRGQYASFDRLQILSLGNRQVVLAMEGQPIKQGEHPIDINVKESTKEDFINAVNKSIPTEGDWYSLMLKECYKNGLKED